MAGSSVVERARCEWHRFREDQPGRRFRNYRTRLHQHASRSLRALCVGGATVLVLAGIAMCFLPGPGVLVLFLGLGMFAGESRWLAGKLDRLEPKARAGGRAIARWWHRRHVVVKAALVVLAIIATGFAMRAWWVWFGPSW